MKTIKIKNRKIGDGQTVFIVAELGINHNGDLALAKKMIKSAKKCGADAVKIQSFITEELIGDKNLEYTYKSQGKKVTETQYHMFKRYELDKKAQKELFDFASKQNIILFSTPQDSNFKTVDYLCSKEINMPAIKVGSDDLTNLPMLSYYAKKMKPLIISAGMATLEEIKDAVNIIERSGNKNLIILKCTAAYPAQSKDLNLLQIAVLRKMFNKIIGFSDHTVGSTAAVAAVILGATVIEKHFTVDKNLPGPDHWFSSDPKEFKQMVEQIRQAEMMPGNTDFSLSEAEKTQRIAARRSLMTVEPIQKGQMIKEDQIVFKRPGSGLSIKHLYKIVGKKAKHDFPKGYIFKTSDLQR